MSSVGSSEPGFDKNESELERISRSDKKKSLVFTSRKGISAIGEEEAIPQRKL